VDTRQSAKNRHRNRRPPSADELEKGDSVVFVAEDLAAFDAAREDVVDAVGK
jgi:hypothetical protein